MKPGHFRLYATTFGLLIAALASFRLWQVSRPPAAGSWTPAHLALPLDATTDRLQVLVDRAPIGEALEGRRLSISKDGNVLPLGASDVSIRLNEVDRIRAARIPGMLALAALAGGGFVLLAIGLATPLIGAFRPHGLVELHLAA